MPDEYSFGPDVDEEAVYRQLHAKYGRGRHPAAPSGEGHLEKLAAQLAELSPKEQERVVNLAGIRRAESAPAWVKELQEDVKKIMKKLGVS
jgi:hypothetical protein